jgi:hypothetical protein
VWKLFASNDYLDRRDMNELGKGLVKEVVSVNEIVSLSRKHVRVESGSLE